MFMKTFAKFARKFLLPGFFLLTLGVGNISVGTYKSQQYEEVLADLERLARSSHSKDILSVSPLRRIQLEKTASMRTFQRETQARSRRDLYQMVIFGGKVFLGISSFLLCFSLAGKLVDALAARMS